MPIYSIGGGTGGPGPPIILMNTKKLDYIFQLIPKWFKDVLVKNFYLGPGLGSNPHSQFQFTIA